MKTLLTLLLLGLLGRTWCCCPLPGDTNIARLGKASQSSTFIGDGNMISSPEKAIDGVEDLDWGHGFCSHTNADMEPWWRLDMKQRYKVTVVVVNGRSDCCLERMMGLEVRIGDSLNNNNPKCSNVTSNFDVTTTFWCNGMEGQYISVVIPGRSEFLALCEVEVYPVEQENDACW